MTHQELADARRSTRYAHYTSRQVVVEGIYAALRRLGFTGGKTLEAGAGVGNFLGPMPVDMRSAEQEDFTKFKGNDGYFDAAVGTLAAGNAALGAVRPPRARPCWRRCRVVIRNGRSCGSNAPRADLAVDQTRAFSWVRMVVAYCGCAARADVWESAQGVVLVAKPWRHCDDGKTIEPSAFFEGGCGAPGPRGRCPMLHSEGTTLATPTRLRRAVAVALACAPFAPHLARAQSGRKIYRVGVLWLIEPQSWIAKAFMDELHRLGLTEKSNLQIETRMASGPSRLDAAAAELVALQPDVIFVASGTLAIKAVARATTSIPVVFLLSSDPVERGVVASLSHPGGNLTGNFCYVRPLDLKRLQLLASVIGDDSSFGVFTGGGSGAWPMQLLEEEYKQTAAGRAGRIRFFFIDEPNDFVTSFEQLVAQGVRGVAINSFPLATSYVSHIAALIEQYRLPAIADGRKFAESGLLLSYSTDWAELAVNSAAMVYNILHGSNPADMALSQATRYELVVNLRTAGALGVTVPRALLVGATHVIR
jgi:putative ABC transport system substrate-binding protein